jgi:glycerol-3-phosphate dehydrogenase (NAD(P)+)
VNERVAVVGAGSWGTALANLLARKGHDVRIWAYEREVVEGINERHENPLYLAGIALSPRLEATADLAHAVGDAATVVSVSPAQHVRRVMGSAAGALRGDARIVSASKGIEKGSLETMAQVLAEVLPPESARTSAYVSGPSFAAEVARELATARTGALADVILPGLHEQ